MGKVLAGLICLTALIVAVVINFGVRKKIIDPRLAVRYAGFCDKML